MHTRTHTHTSRVVSSGHPSESWGLDGSSPCMTVHPVHVSSLLPTCPCLLPGPVSLVPRILYYGPRRSGSGGWRRTDGEIPRVTRIGHVILFGRESLPVLGGRGRNLLGPLFEGPVPMVTGSNYRGTLGTVSGKTLGVSGPPRDHRSRGRGSSRTVTGFVTWAVWERAEGEGWVFTSRPERTKITGKGS